eukprot:CAMPEP_0206430464 /NCGR_PEP_ID=MMETSP0324_2-20121206/6830_1 /ASSEMBLY_ACC=CAM_ASM_000836 /TAXON_ID=2866 /ORGANISM="Crypthecodinium cohnii, Strain Seligo" /LENGTH=194 /DNA_ID=CAMNT_0053896297 /DNA_START=340 /DNA_END=924 /DNA_ORIENTATION=-
MTSLFLAHRSLESAVRVRLVSSGAFPQQVAKSNMAVTPLLAKTEDSEMELECGRGRHKRSVGKVVLSLQTWVLPKGDLKECLRTLDAREQKTSYLTGSMPADIGYVVSSPPDEEEDPFAVRPAYLLREEPISTLPNDSKDIIRGVPLLASASRSASGGASPTQATSLGLNFSPHQNHWQQATPVHSRTWVGLPW